MNNISVGIIALISAGIGSLLAPWVNWGIEKRKIKLQDKKHTLDTLRSLVLDEYEKFESFMKEYTEIGKNKYEKKLYEITYFDALNKHSIFHKIKPFLQNETISILKDSNMLIYADRGASTGQLPTPFEKLMENLSEIEKDWKLI